jgi:hypothetical protein
MELFDMNFQVLVEQVDGDAVDESRGNERGFMSWCSGYDKLHSALQPVYIDLHEVTLISTLQSARLCTW